MLLNSHIKTYFTTINSQFTLYNNYEMKFLREKAYERNGSKHSKKNSNTRSLESDPTIKSSMKEPQREYWQITTLPMTLQRDCEESEVKKEMGQLCTGRCDKFHVER